MAMSGATMVRPTGWTGAMSTSTNTNATATATRAAKGSGAGGCRTSVRMGVDEWKARAAKVWHDVQFENWAPRSSRAWRLREFQSELETKGPAGEADRRFEASVRGLERASSSRRGGDPFAGGISEASLAAWAAEAEAAEAEAAEASAGTGSSDVRSVQDEEFVCALALPGSLEEAKEEVARLREESGPSVLTGRELSCLLYVKYGFYHDLAIKHDQFKPAGGRLISVNIYYGHLGQRSFPLTVRGYVEKMDVVAGAITAWDSAAYVRSELDQPPTPKRGLPSRPRYDTAVSIALHKSPTWNDALVSEFFLH